MSLEFFARRSLMLPDRREGLFRCGTGERTGFRKGFFVRGWTGTGGPAAVLRAPPQSAMSFPRETASFTAPK